MTMILKTTKFGANRVSGWCSQPSGTDQQPIVELRVDGDMLAQTVADLSLNEVDPDTTSKQRVGFAFDLPATLRDGMPHHVEVRETSQFTRESKVVEPPNSVVSDEENLFGEYHGFDRGMVIGWACKSNQTVTPEVRVDGTRVAVEPLSDAVNSLRARHGFGAVISPKFYDGEEHLVEVLLPGQAGEYHLLSQETLRFSPDLKNVQWWRRATNQYEDIIVDSLHLTNAEAVLTLVGEVRHKRVALRLGYRRFVMDLVSPPASGEGKTRALGQYAVQFHKEAKLPSSLELYNAGGSLKRSFDVRLGDETGRRPSYLPQTLAVKSQAVVGGRNELLPTLNYWAQEIRREGRPRLAWFSSLARETQSLEARDVLALVASGGSHDYDSLMETLELSRLRSSDWGIREALGKRVWLPGLFTLAQVIYSQRLNQQDFNDVYAIYESVEHAYGRDAFNNGVDRSYYADLLTQRGFTDKACDLLAYEESNQDRAYSQRFLEFNAFNPHTPGNSEAQNDQWFAGVNQLYDREGFSGLASQDGRAPDFFSLQGESVASSADSSLPLVTVIMPIYEPNAATDVAIGSLLEQTWSNLEIIIIDDASPEVDESGDPTPYRQQLQGWAAKDERIRLVLCEENRGAYSVRNEAFGMAQGEFVTIADKDDWHHPQRIQFQARDLMANSGKHGNIVNWVRVDEQLQFQIRWGPDRIVHPSFACIMFRRREVLEKLGVWDPVRKSADNEYRKRFEMVFGQKLKPAVNAPLAFSLLGEGNLTSSDFGLGYRHPDREVYQWAYSHWHDQIQKGRSPQLSGEAREFYSPPAFRPDRNKDDVPHFDVVYISELGLLGGPALAAKREIETAVAAGLKVAIMPLQNGLHMAAAKRRLAPEIEELWLSGSAEWITWNSAATADLVVLSWPGLMELRPGSDVGLQPSAVTIVANQLPASLGSRGRNFSVQRVTRNVEKTFGVFPTWAAQSPVVQEALRELLSTDDVRNALWLTPSTGHTDYVGRKPENRDRAVIGRVLDEDESHWPEPAVIRDAYPEDPAFEVSILSRVRTLESRGILRGRSVPTNWTILPPDFQSYDDYLRSLDFLVHYGNEPWDPHTDGSVVRALELGVVCVLHPVFKPVYGDAAVYVAPGEIRDTLHSMWGLPEKMREQRKRGQAYVKGSRTARHYVRLLRGQSTSGG
ncbi:glycosyltransferase family 2 protein [Garicola koreensis]|uniref:Glycosyltransferase 2-like domain-containing protein n=1 Tax=Garicola koreensis TaxID=1262554 RepID=A0A7W5TVX8_9MICC|nr:glycosyltransferase family A protein [Garicola koreensis]MBB3667594.1 hypothetical protein [Garicola koreensis]